MYPGIWVYVLPDRRRSGGKLRIKLPNANCIQSKDPLFRDSLGIMKDIQKQFRDKLRCKNKIDSIKKT